MPSEVGKNVRMRFISQKTCDGVSRRKISLYCQLLGVSRQGFYRYKKINRLPWKYRIYAECMIQILSEDEWNYSYGRVRMREALVNHLPEGISIPSINTVQKIMNEIGIIHHKKRKPNGVTKAERNARKSENLLKRDFQATAPAQKCITDITEIKAKDGKLYVSAIFDCYDSAVLGLSMDTNMKAKLCVKTVTNALERYPELRYAVLHSDRGAQYTSEEYRAVIMKYNLKQSMNSDGGRCHDNARCESTWARMKEEMIYGKIKSTEYTVEQLKKMIWRYFMSYWNNRRICNSNQGLPPMVKREKYYRQFMKVA